MTALIVLASKCAMIYHGLPNNNYGAASSFQTGRGVSAFSTVSGIMWFDLSFLDAGVRVNSAYVSLFSGGVQNSNASRLLQMPAADADWVEGTKLSGVETGSCCWDYYAYKTVTWSGGEGVGNSTFIANFNSPTPQYAEVQIVLSPAMVQAWVGPGGVNPGLLAEAQEGTVAARSMWSDDTEDPEAYSPRLTMDVTYPPTIKPPIVWPHYRM